MLEVNEYLGGFFMSEGKMGLTDTLVWFQVGHCA